VADNWQWDAPAPVVAVTHNQRLRVTKTRRLNATSSSWCHHPRLSNGAAIPNSGLKMVMPASAKSNWKAHLGATLWRTLDGKNPNGWFREQKLSVAETIEAYTMGSGYADSRSKKKV
jgi:hypothetical protein